MTSVACEVTPWTEVSMIMIPYFFGQRILESSIKSPMHYALRSFMDRNYKVRVSSFTCFAFHGNQRVIVIQASVLSACPPHTGRRRIYIKFPHHQFFPRAYVVWGLQIADLFPGIGPRVAKVPARLVGEEFQQVLGVRLCAHGFPAGFIVTTFYYAFVL